MKQRQTKQPLFKTFFTFFLQRSSCLLALKAFFVKTTAPSICSDSVCHSSSHTGARHLRYSRLHLILGSGAICMAALVTWWLFPNDNLIAAKPIIYLYPTHSETVTVTLGRPTDLIHTYPKYDKGWRVQAEPNGDLKDLSSNRSLYALYWEGKITKRRRLKMKEGFCVPAKETIAFLEKKLAALGLSEREANEMIIYWLPHMERSAYNYIRFQSIAQQDENMPLSVEPKPDTVIRVMMEYMNLSRPIKVKEQILPPTPERKGFTVVEWGGINLAER